MSMRWRDGTLVAFGFVAICVGYAAFLVAETFNTKWSVVIAVVVFVAIVLAAKKVNDRSEGPQ